MKSFIIHIIIIFLFLLNSCDSKIYRNEFNDIFKLANKAVIKIDSSSKISLLTIRLLSDYSILIFDKNRNMIQRYNLKGKELSKFTIKTNIRFDSEFSIDRFGNIYHLLSSYNILEKYDNSGKRLKTFRVVDGQSFYISNSKIYLYKRFYSPNESSIKKTIFEYSLEGDSLDSYGIFPKQPCIDNLPFSSGSINLKDSLLITAHGSDFFCNIYNISNNNNLIKLNISQPSFYYKLKEFKGLTPAYRKEWYKTTELLYANILFDKSIILYYKQVDGSKKWLVIHTNNKNKEILIPNELNFLGCSNQKLCFVKLSDTKAQLEITEYKVKK